MRSNQYTNDKLYTLLLTSSAQTFKNMIFFFAYEILYLGEGTAYVPHHAMGDDIFTLVLAPSTTQCSSQALSIPFSIVPPCLQQPIL